ncbi:MAG: hypothetical protein ACRBB2_06270 [Nitrosopumilus sp.]
MTGENKVSILWQIIFVLFVPIVGIWAFYRIKKLQKFLLFVVLPSIALISFFLIPIAFLTLDEQDNLESEYGVIQDFEGYGFLVIGIFTGSMALTAWEIYLILKWSEDWNKQFM